MLNLVNKLDYNVFYDVKRLSPQNTSRDSKNYLFAFVANHLTYYPTPINLTYAWSFRFLAGMCLLTQMISGIFLCMHYTPHVDLAFSSVEYIMRDVPNGWFLRYVHANGASMFFIVVYSHIFRGLYYGSYTKPRELLWCSGVILFVLIMATAFTGYVLPWGQMSFWGGFTVNNPTLNRFFSIYFVLPFLIAGVTLIHLALLHKDGSNNPIGFDAGIDDVPFYPYFVSKDMFAFFCFLFFFGIFVFYFPNVLNHPDNCIFAIFSNKKKIKEYLSKFSSLLFMYKFDCFFITIGIVFFLLELYVPFIYSITTVFYYKFLVHHFSVWDEKKLLLEHATIDNTIYDEIEWGYFQLFTVTLIIIISVVFNAIFAKFYLAVLLLGAVIRFSGFKMSQHFPSVLRRFKQIKKDLITLKYHWYKDFKVARDIVYISLISLGISLFLATILPLLFHIPEDVLKLNFNIWCVALLIHCFFVFLIDTYIIFFANMPVIHKLSAFCQRCVGLGVGVTYSNYQLTDNGITCPNPIFNKTRDYLGLPRTVDYDQIKQYRLMKKFFPHMPETDYTHQTPGVKNSTSMSTLDFIKIARENEDLLRNNCTADELKTFRLDSSRRTR